MAVEPERNLESPQEGASPPSGTRQIARAAGTVMAAFVISQVVGLARYVFVAQAFGTGPQMEAFTAANRVPDLLFNLVAGGALASAFIPTFSSLLAHDDRRQAWQLASAIANLILLIVSVASLLAAVFAPLIVTTVLAPGFAARPGQVELTVALMRLMLPSAAIFGLSGLTMGILNSHQVFLVPALAPSMYSLGMIFGSTVLKDRLGIFGLAWGVLIGASLHLLVQVPALLRRGGSYSLTLGLDLAPVREVGRLLGPRLVGVGVVQLNFWLNVWLASLPFMLEGSINGVTYAFSVMLTPQAVIAQSIAIAAMPTLASQAALGKMSELRSSLAASLRGVLLLSIPATVGLVILRRPLVQVIYQRGEFDAFSTELVAWALLWYGLGLVGHSVVEVAARAFYAMHDTRTPVVIGAGAMTLNLVFSVLFSLLFARIGWMPHGGLALANSVATALEMAGLLVLMRRRLDGLEGRQVLAGAAQATAASALMGAGVWAWLANSAGRPAWLVAAAGVALGAAIYAAAVFVLGVPEARSLLRLVKRFIWPPSQTGAPGRGH